MSDKITFQQSKDIIDTLNDYGFEYTPPNPLLTDQDIDNIEQSLLHIAAPEETPNPMITYDGGNNIIVATIIRVINGEIITYTGVAKKRKGDVYNPKVGQTIALIRAVDEKFSDEGNENSTANFSIPASDMCILPLQETIPQGDD